MTTLKQLDSSIRHLNEINAEVGTGLRYIIEPVAGVDRFVLYMHSDKKGEGSAERLVDAPADQMYNMVCLIKRIFRIGAEITA
jgi:hypothetical protein